MALKQIAVFVENRPGTLAEITDLLAGANIDIRALSISETQDFGILRMIVSDLDKAKAILSANGLVCKINHVLGVEIPDVPGAMAKVIRILSDAGINIEYVYAFVGNSGKKAWVALRMSNHEKGEKLLTEKGYRLFEDNDINDVI